MPAEFEKPQEVELPLEGAALEIPTLLDATPIQSLSFTLVKQLKVVPATPMDPHVLLKMNSVFELVDCIRNAPVMSAVDSLCRARHN